MDKSATRRAESVGLMFFAGAMFLAGLLLAETSVALEQMTVSLDLSRSQQGSLVSLRFVGGLVVGLRAWGLTLLFLSDVVTQYGLPDRAATLFMVVSVAAGLPSLGLVRRSA